jgi:hypothetical protein
MKIIESNGVFTTASVTATHDKLPVGNYMLKFSPKEGYYLVKKEAFKLPKKIYGDHSIVHRWLKSYQENSEKNMGIILSGLKGSGKTITAQKFCVEANKPVIMITEPFFGSDFIDYITQFPDAIIFIDEFEKVYANNEKSNDLLLLMDGNYPTRFIFLLTVNEMRINNFLMNRLNRVKYRKDYIDLDQATMDEVIDDMLVNKEHRESIYQFFKKINMQTFDLLVNLIKEMNLFNEDALVCGSHLNLESEKKKYELFEEIDGKIQLQQYVEIQGDAESFMFSRSHNPSKPKGWTDEQWDDMESPLFDYTTRVVFADCNITQPEEGIMVLELKNKPSDPWQVPHNKLIMKQLRTYKLVF